MIWRALLAFAALMSGAFGSLVMLASESCSENVADALHAWVIVLPMNLLGMIVLGWRPNRIAVVLVAAIPALAAAACTHVAWLLATGVPACTITTGITAWEASGEETMLAMAWGLTAAIFWIGLAYALSGGYRPAHDSDP